MSKRKKKRKSRFGPETRRQRQPPIDLEQTFSQVDDLIVRGCAQEALDLLAPLLNSHPRVADLHYYIGYARVKAGDIWGGLAGYEQAIKLSHDPSYCLPLASLYLEVELNAHALHAFRQVLKHPPEAPSMDHVREAVVSLESDVQTTADNLGLSMTQVEKGLWQLEDGLRAMQKNDFPACIAANRRASRLLADWPPPRNNLSLALFYDGQPEKAIDTARQVLSHSPDNIQALSNIIRFLSWTGQESEARAFWPRLKEITPRDNDERRKMTEAAAVLGEDESVYQLLKPLDEPDAMRPGMARVSWQVQLFLAVAEANTGRGVAQGRLKTLQKDAPWAGDLLATLKAGKPGPGWAERFPYFHISEILPRPRIDELVELVGRKDELPPKRFRNLAARFVTRFPQIVLMAEKMIWEDNQPSAGVAILETVATPAAYAALRRFGLSQAGEDEARTQALFYLLQAGEIAQDETLRVWTRGEWREVQLRPMEVSDEPRTVYAPKVADVLVRALEALQQDNDGQAERLFRQMLKLEPRAKEAYNNLGAIYSHRGDHTRAKEMYRAALEIEPLYVFPRCNLASYLLDDKDVDGATDMIAPLAEATRLHPQEMAFYSYTQARILAYEEEYKAAREALEMALKMWPDYEPAQAMLERLDTFEFAHTSFDSFFERQHQRDRAKRVRMQTQLSTPDPSLSTALSVYTKEVLTGMARVILPWGGWSALRKAELFQKVVEGLGDRDNVEHMVADLDENERAALRLVLAHGGHMPWEDFDAEHDNDMEESPYWQWHEPETTMGRLRLRGLLAEATVNSELRVAVPSELRPMLREMLD